MKINVEMYKYATMKRSIFKLQTTFKYRITYYIGTKRS